jgi:hypothetical protein
MLVDTKIITIARTEIVVAVAMGWLLLFLLFRCVICVSCPNTTPKAKCILILSPCSPYNNNHSLQQIIDERISFLKEQINQDNKPEVNSTFQLQIDAIRSVDDDIEKVEFIIQEKKALLKNSKDVHESDRLFAELDGLEWLQRQRARYS